LGSARTVLRFLPHLGLLLAIIAVVLLALVPIGWRGGWWPYRFSLLSLMSYSAYFGIAAVIVSVLALVISVPVASRPPRPRPRPVCFAGLERYSE
jgi:hypothetical protein